jgi:predicted GH43/DUF377 family glycosyl hydrolase
VNAIENSPRFVTASHSVRPSSVAVSKDGIRWTKHERNPILTPIPGSPYESVYNSSQSVIRDGDHYKMYYATRIDMIHKYYAICMARKSGKILA